MSENQSMKYSKIKSKYDEMILRIFRNISEIKYSSEGNAKVHIGSLLFRKINSKKSQN